jgi:TM2 domain-containing membrane protein YozV
MHAEDISPKSRLVAVLLCFFLGVFGAHRFYVGKIGTGILQILTLGGIGIWALIDLIMVTLGSFRDAERRRVFMWLEPGSVTI